MFTLQIQHWRHGLALCAMILGLSYVQVAVARPWTTLEGKVVEAELVDIVHDGNAVVLDVSGKRYEVPLERLSPKDRGYVQGLKDANFKPSDAEINREIDEAVSDDEKGEVDRSQPVRLSAERIWRSRDGNAVEAKFLRMVYGTVILKEGPRYHRIQYYDLSLNDRKFLFDAHKAINKEAIVPPVRPDLKDPAPQLPAYDNQQPGPSNPAPMPTPSSSPSNSTIPSSSDSVLPGSGFGATSADTKLPPSGFGATPDTTSLPPNGFGSTPSTNTNSNVALPPSGFGSVSPAAGSSSSNVKLPSNGFGSPSPEPTPEVNTPFDPSVKLPQNGFGNMQAEPITEERGSFDSIPSSAGFGSQGHVKIPSSTIVDNGPGSNSQDNRPLFDVASLPPSSSGFGSSNSPTGSNMQSGNASSSGSAPRPAAQPQNPTSAITNPSDSQYKPQTYTTPQADFTAFQPAPPREFTTTDWNLQIFSVTLLGTGSMMIAGGYLWIVAIAFLENHQSGVRSLVPGMAIVYGLSEWEKSSTALIAMLLGVCLTLGGFGLLMSVS